MTNDRSLRFALLAQILVTALGCVESTRLAPTFSPGQTYTHHVRIVSDIILPMAIRDADHKETELDLEYHVRDVDDDGRALLEITIARIQASMKTLGGMAFTFDSEKEHQDPANVKPDHLARQKEFENVFADLKGKKYAALIDAQGRLSELRDVDPALQTLAAGRVQGMIGKDQAAMIFSETSLREFACLPAFAALPENAPNRQDSWISYEPVVVPRAPAAAARKRYLFENIEQRDGQKVALISFKTDDPETELPPDTLPSQLTQAGVSGGFDIVSVRGEGEIAYALTDRRLLKLDEKIKTQIKPHLSRALQKEGADKGRKIFYLIHKTIERVQP